MFGPGQKKPKPTRVRGYRIRYQVEGQEWMKSHIGVLWQPEPLLPPEWEATKQNPRVLQAVLIRSGRKYDRYSRTSLS